MWRAGLSFTGCVRENYQDKTNGIERVFDVLAFLVGMFKSTYFQNQQLGGLNY